MKLNDLVLVPEYANALKPLSARARAGLKGLISESEKVLCPILFHLTPSGEPAVIDGYHRLQLRDELIAEGVDIPDPRTEEVISLSGSEKEEVVQWIRQHQAWRRNDTSLEKQVELGESAIELAEQGSTVSEIAESVGVTPAVVSHAMTAARDARHLRESDPESADAVLSDPSASPRDLAKASSRPTNGKATSQRSSTKGPLIAFKPINEALNQLSRRIDAAGKQHGAGSFHDDLLADLASMRGTLQSWEDSVMSNV